MKGFRILINTWVFFLFLTNIGFCQNYHLFGDKIFGGNSADGSLRIAKYGDKLLLIGTSKSSPMTGNHLDSSCNHPSIPITNDVWMVEFDVNYNILMQKSCGGTNQDEEIRNVEISSDGQIIFSARSNSDSSCEKTENNRNYPQFSYDYWICSIDSNGNKIWDKTFGSTGVENSPIVCELSNGNFVLGGITGGGIDGDKTVANYGSTDYWVVKFDSIGNKIWDFVYGGSGQELDNGVNGEGFSILSTENNSFILFGSTHSIISGNISEPSQGLSDLWMIKIDDAGNKIWDKRYGGDLNESASKIVKTPDSGFVLVANTRSNQTGNVSEPTIGNYDVWVLKLDSLGNKQWDKRYGGTGRDFANSIEVAPDGGYWISAETDSPSGFDVTDSSYGLTDYWMFKIDSVGNKLWDKRFGGPGIDQVSNFVIMEDSSIFLCGFADSGMTAVKTEFGYGGFDYWVVHFYYGGNQSIGVHEITQEEDISIYPNPANNEISIATNSNLYPTSILILDVSGKLICKYTLSENMQIDISHLSQGVYFLQINSTLGNIITKKLVKLNID